MRIIKLSGYDDVEFEVIIKPDGAWDVKVITKGLGGDCQHIIDKFKVMPGTKKETHDPEYYAKAGPKDVQRAPNPLIRAVR